MVTHEEFMNALRRGANPAGDFEGISAEDKVLLVAKVERENRGAYKAALEAAKAAEIEAENERNR